ncbi:hypothetical protein B5G58_28030 (plasmid) [Klebsiella pneumoniae]|nr:hypothetical protein B5G58_28030 [Klebsiella pneumoniae]
MILNKLCKLSTEQHSILLMIFLLYQTFFIHSLVRIVGNDSNLLIVFYVQIVPDDFVMQLHRF